MSLWPRRELASASSDCSTPGQALYLPQHNDYLVQPQDYQRLIQELPNIVNILVVDWRAWNHLDALSGIEAPRSDEY